MHYNKISIIHFQPIELYPPTLNFLEYLKKYKFQIKVHTSIHFQQNINQNFRYFKVYRSVNPTKYKNKFRRLLSYSIFNWLTLIRLIFENPAIVIYYESYSAMAAYRYMRWFGKNKTLWMHSHEYFPPDWYVKGMKTVRAYHKKEINYFYPRATGLSQTNSYRVDFFLKDYPFLPPEKVHAFPNYPPKTWKESSRNLEKISTPVKTLYIGSVSLRATYIKEYCEWLVAQNGNVTLDIYAYPIDEETRNYLTSLPNNLVQLFDEGIEYTKIPSIIHAKKYEVGLILYKGLYTNTVYCASNKLFEYLACGLDVWLTDKMIGSFEYITKGTYPKVIKMNYEKLDNYSLEELIDHVGLTYKPSEYYCEEVYEGFVRKLEGES